MNKSDETKTLKRKIKSLEQKLRRIQSGNSGSDFIEKEKLLNELQEKEIQIETQKLELLDKQSELEESLGKYADLFDFAPVGYLTLDKNLTIKDINLIALNMLGYEHRYIKSIPLIHFIKNGQSLKFFKYFRECKIQNTHLTEEFLIINKFSKNIYVQITSIPMHDYKKKELDYRISLLDITERKEIENELKESEERFRLMADASPLMIWMFDKNMQLEYVNKTIINFLGKNFSEFKDGGFFDLVHPDDRGMLKEELEKTFRNKSPFNLEVRVMNKEGEYRWLLNNAAPRNGPDGSFAGHIGSSVDISESVKARKGLENSLKEKEILIKEIHHRVKNNLQIISSILSLQEHYLNDKPITDILSGCRNRVYSMSLIHEQLYHSKDFLEINFKNYLKLLIKQLQDSYSNTVPITFILDIDKINMDVETSINLGLILNELITNSLKYAFKDKDKGKIKIALKRLKEENKIILKVSDNGSGLPKNFNIKQLKSLGLEIVTSIAEQLKGELKINNNGRTEFQIIMEPF